MTTKEKISVRLPAPLLKQLEKRAKKECKTLTEVIESILGQHTEERLDTIINMLETALSKHN